MVVRGLEGEVVVNGVKYNSVMPAMTQLSDQEIASNLGISYRTVTSYVRNILTKLDVRTRTAAATHAIRRGLV